jgi:dynein heavy chain, axonemal
LTKVPAFSLKAIQLYDTIRVRHGLMLVGEAMAGKSEITDTLANALTRIGDKVDIIKINPKSVSIGRLYGDYEKLTRDWQDGILAKTVR